MKNKVCKSVNVEIPDHVWHDIRRFLEARESDIALGMEDFGCLDGVFQYAFKRLPKDKVREVKEAP